MKKYKNWGTCLERLVNNLLYIRPADQLEVNKQVPQNMVLDYPYPGATYQTLLWTGSNKNKYWHGICQDCGAVHIVRSDKIKGKRCKCIRQPG